MKVMKSVIILFFILMGIFDCCIYSKEPKEILLETVYELENSTLFPEFPDFRYGTPKLFSDNLIE